MHFGLGAHDQGVRGDGETRLWPEYWIPFQCLRLFPFHETTNSCFTYLKGIFGKKQTCNDAKYLKQLNKSFWYLFKNIWLWIFFVELLVYCWNGYQFLLTYVSLLTWQISNVVILGWRWINREDKSHGSKMKKRNLINS